MAMNFWWLGFPISRELPPAVVRPPDRLIARLFAAPQDVPICGESMKSNLFENQKSKRRAWRHPAIRSLAVPYRAAAAVALLDMGVRDYATIAQAVGLSIADVERIETAEDRPIRDLCSARIPFGTYFKLDAKVRCPKCSAWIVIAPCIACDRPSSLRPKLPEALTTASEG